MTQNRKIFNNKRNIFRRIYASEQHHRRRCFEENNILINFENRNKNKYFFRIVDIALLASVYTVCAKQVEKETVFVENKKNNPKGGQILVVPHSLKAK